MPPRRRREPATRRPADPTTRPGPAAELPVAQVAVDVSLPHLDRPFDYLVPEPLSPDAQPGVRVRVRFAGRLLDGFVLDRVAESSAPGRLASLERVVSPEPVLTREIARLSRLVADRYAGTLADVLRLAVPPRHAAAEVRAAEARAPATANLSATSAEAVHPRPWEPYPGGPEFLAALHQGGQPRVVWSALPGTAEDTAWPTALAAAVAATVAGGRGAVVVLPDGRDVTRLDAALTQALGTHGHVALTADLGPRERYTRWLRALRGETRAVIGTRAAAFAPLADLGLAVIWDDGDDLHAEPRAPYPHAREVLLLRAHGAGAAMLVAGHSVTAEGALLVRSGWARAMAAPRTVIRAAAPGVRTTDEDIQLARDPAARSARLPSLALTTARDCLASGPVLVQVPRRGYQPALACATCRASARCGACNGPLRTRQGAASHHVPSCRWCGRPAADWRCGHCGGQRLRATVVGSQRTAEELGRALPGVPIRTSAGDGVLATVGPEPAVVVCTPGAEPWCDTGYAGALLLDAWALLGRADLRAGEEALRRWLGAAALVRPASDGGIVVLVGDVGTRPAQALVRWQPGWHAEREYDDRAALHFPPAARVAAVTGTPAAVADLVQSAELPPAAELLGPVPEPTASAESATERMLIRVPRGEGRALAAALHAASAVRSARKAPDPVRVQLDPLVML